MSGDPHAADLVRFSLRLREDFLEDITEEADRRHDSINDVLNRAVGEYLSGERVWACSCCGKPL